MCAEDKFRPRDLVTLDDRYAGMFRLLYDQYRHLATSGRFYHGELACVIVVHHKPNNYLWLQLLTANGSYGIINFVDDIHVVS